MRINFGPRGRLGNVMLQAAACIGFAKKHNYQWGIPSYIREVPRFHEFFPGLPIDDNRYNGYEEHPNDDFCHVHQCNKGKCWFNYHEIPNQNQNVTLHGFWQSWRYFENAEEEVKQAFKLKEYPELKGYVSIHVRRGDYVQYADSFPPVTVNYIDHAIYHVEESLGVGEPKLIFFSDDINWCREFFGRYERVEFAEGNDEITDLSMMASCSHHIIANSTFSWWGAYLGHNPDKIVVSPSHKRGCWFGHSSGVQTDCIDLLPPSWQQIEFR